MFLARSGGVTAHHIADTDNKFASPTVNGILAAKNSLTDGGRTPSVLAITSISIRSAASDLIVSFPTGAVAKFVRAAMANTVIIAIRKIQNARFLAANVW